MYMCGNVYHFPSALQELQTQWEVIVNYLYQLAMKFLSTTKLHLHLKIIEHEEVHRRISYDHCICDFLDHARQMFIGCKDDDLTSHTHVCTLFNMRMLCECYSSNLSLVSAMVRERV